ncbi:MAG: 2-phospho-L-lactate guanylyltransferase [Nitrososphaerota archaeon]|jgi:2-phospho-L-lactate guanylyltransferase|nr:2-phospho-L-lactate guanylyltransferase [Nitrososphaerota archaeon]
MTRLAVVIPVKSTGVKSRLSAVLSAAQRKELGMLMLEDVLAAVAGAGLSESCFVVSSDRAVLELAARHRAKGVQEEGDSGVNHAVEAGVMASRAGRVLVLPADLPLLSSADVEAVVSLADRGAEVVLSPSMAFDGTNSLIFSAEAGLRLSYDRDSFWNHLASAASAGLSAAVSARPGVMLDIDSPDDLRRLAASPSAGRAARYSRTVVL